MYAKQWQCRETELIFEVRNKNKTVVKWSDLQNKADLVKNNWQSNWQVNWALLLVEWDLLLKSRVNQFLANFPLLITGKFSKQVSEMQSYLCTKTLPCRFPQTAGVISQLPVRSSTSPASVLHIQVLVSLCPPHPALTPIQLFWNTGKQNPLLFLGCGTFASTWIVFKF